MDWLEILSGMKHEEVHVGSREEEVIRRSPYVAGRSASYACGQGAWADTPRGERGVGE